MAEAVASNIVTLAAMYLATGFLYMLIVQLKGAASFDRAAQGAGVGFKLIIIPGLILLWPVLFFKLRSRKADHEEPSEA